MLSFLKLSAHWNGFAFQKREPNPLSKTIATLSLCRIVATAGCNYIVTRLQNNPLLTQNRGKPNVTVDGDLMAVIGNCKLKYNSIKRITK